MLSFIIVTMNRKDKLRRCLQSVVAQEMDDKEIIVLDNGSSDGTAEMVRSEFPQVRLVPSASNLGVGGGRNEAVRHASGEVLVLLDDDEYVIDATAAARLAEYFSASSAAQAVVFSLIDADGALFTNYIPRFDKCVMENDSPCACLMSGACAIQKDVYDALGGFWPLLNPYGYEDRDFMFRFLQSGYRAIWSRQISVVHDKDEDPNLNPRWVEYMLPHHGWVALRHLPWRYVASYLAYGWPYFAYKAARHGYFLAYARSLVRFFRHLPEVLRLRQPLSREVIAYCKAHSGRLRY